MCFSKNINVTEMKISTFLWVRWKKIKIRSPFFDELPEYVEALLYVMLYRRE